MSEEESHLKRGNMLWESSRMFLPEHREQLLEMRRRKRDYVAPELAEDRLAELNVALGEALLTGRTVVVTYADPAGPQRAIGHITRIDPHRASLHIDIDGQHATELRLDQLLYVE